ncbi:TRAP transporter small permease [Celeribacter indicus]|uniref:TRAP transporter small permease protein n=1 Tax=Celeribacter indicus TaxID=1208324 RepID=A0A0B5E9W2_9RHOB|nr:TRAP transporter small permease [Celeribacter indicus]AJE49117.1 tripartite ATP-independent periplasmic transporter DctQ [Celeribacter indicus]SDX48469.1 TRAP-type C4-dicarboxylate transport system, small permease component [Celeribacter indicus]
MSEKQGSPPRGPFGPGGVLDTAVRQVETVLLYLLCLVLFVMMVLIAADALGRYSMNRPLTFTVDLVTMYLLPAAMLLPAGLVLRRGGHIGVDLFAMMMPRRLYHALIGLGLLASAPIFWIMTHRIALMASDSLSQKLVATGMVPWPIWAEQAIFALAMGLFTLRALHIGVSQLVAAVTGDSAQAISILPDGDTREHSEEAV